jgi:hypothetical protein
VLETGAHVLSDAHAAPTPPLPGGEHVKVLAPQTWLPAEQSTQDAPLAPQSSFAEVTQVPALQHSNGWQPVQTTWHDPETQACPDPHAAQATPPVPHSELLSAPTAMQVAPLQQPAQLAALQAGLQEPL